MDFGIVFPAGLDTHEDVQHAEHAGFSHAWIYDSQMLFSDPYICMARCAEHTKTIKIGTGVTNPSSRIAPVTANSFATINALAPGRVVLGIGTGNTARRTLGMPAAKLDELREHVRICADLLAGKTTEYVEGDRQRQIKFLNPDGSWYNIDDRIPIFIAASGPKSLRLAGEIADGVILFGAVSPVLIDFVMKHVRAGAEQAGQIRKHQIVQRTPGTRQVQQPARSTLGRRCLRNQLRWQFKFKIFYSHGARSYQ